MAIHRKYQRRLDIGISPHISQLIFLLFIIPVVTIVLTIFGNQYVSDASAIEELVEDRSFSVSVPLSLDIVLSSNHLPLTIKPTKNGQFGRSYMSVYVDTNNITGYHLTMEADSDILTNKGGSNGSIIDSIPSITTSVSCTDESDTTCNTFPSNYWGYHINKDDSTVGSYLSASSIVNKPIELAHTNDITTSTDPAATIYFGAKVDETKASGIYDGVNLNFIATSNMTAFTITVKPTNGIASIKLGDNEPCTNKDNGCSYTLEYGTEHILKVVTEQNYSFTGWSNSTEYGSFSDSANTTTTFTVGKGDAIISANNEFINACPNKASTYTDSRDGQVYRIGTLLDGKCWMLQDLNLGGNGNISVELNSTNTNLKAGTTVSAAKFNGWKKTSGTYNYTDGEWIVNGDYGVLYNYCAASAGTYCYSYTAGPTSTTSGEITGTGDTAAQRAIVGDICPAGWRLPTGGKDGEFMALAKEYGYTKTDGTYMDDTTLFGKMTGTLANGGANFSLSGNFNGGTPTYQGSNGYFWSSSRVSAASMYNLRLDKSNNRVYPAYDGLRVYGFSVRCVLGS